MEQFAFYLSGSANIASITAKMWQNIDWCYIFYALNYQLSAILLATNPRWYLYQALGSNLLWVLPWAIVVTKIKMSQEHAWTFYSIIFGGSLVFSFLVVVMVLLLWASRLMRGKITLQRVEKDEIPNAYIGHINGSAASKMAEGFTETIFGNLSLLRRHIDAYGDVILKRWRFRRPEKRKELILQIAPALYPTRIPMIDLGARLTGKTYAEQDQYRYAYLLPYLNLETLSSLSNNLIRLIHHRISSQPDQWVVYDNELIQPISEAFKSMFQLTHLNKSGARGFGFGFDVRDYNTIYKRDPVGWCLHHLIIDLSDPFKFPAEVVLQYLDELLTIHPEEFRRLDQEICKWISDMVAVERMLALLKYHRPNYHMDKLDPEPPCLPRFKAWQMVWLKESTFKGDTPTADEFGLHIPLLPLDKFKIPKAIKDEAWLKRRDSAHQALRTIWGIARQGYQAMLKHKGVPQATINPQLEQMRQSESVEHLMQLETESQQILARLNQVKVLPVEDEYRPLPTSSDQYPTLVIPQPVKEKQKTRPADVPSLTMLSLSPEPLELREESPPTLYILKTQSLTYRFITALFPAPDDEPSKKCYDWVGFVTAMSELGFRAEHRGGSAFTFKGDIKLPEAPTETSSRSINFHMPHGSVELSSVMLQSMGRRLNRRFGWLRENFRVED
ncbi:MAG: hypothetical protein Q9222_004770 [Ikaeria aurantiellina]